MRFHNVDQKSEEWIKLRLGVPTASDFDKIMTPKKMELSKSATKLAYRLIGEKLSPYLPERAESYMSRAMEWGVQTENEARALYAMETDLVITNGGFCMTDDGHFGCSPDGLVGDEGGLELKCPEAGTHIEYLCNGVLPDEYKPQVHGQLIVTGRKWVDFMSYSINLPPFVVRVTPDLYTEQLKKMLYGEFLPLLEAIRKKVEGARLT